MTWTIDDDLYVTRKTGLGIEQPQERLEVNGNVKATSFLGDGSNLTGVVKNLDLAVKKAGDTMTGALTIQNNLTVTGNVGIATTAAPSEELEVNGNVKATSFLGDGSNLDKATIGAHNNTLSAWSDLILQTDGGNVGIGTSTPNAKLTVDDPSGNTVWNTAAFRKAALGPNWSHIHWGTTGDWYIRSAANAGKVLIQDLGGNVGIGTNNPQQKLHIDGGHLTITNNGNTFTISVEGNRVVFYLSNAYHGTNKRISWDGDNNWDQVS